eukprot:TRINITY_DN58603_c0_g1_i1.p2 TRINITY_DN58603_c0_g1~~TRINITY_DN58603_c0_g1_i1.p2  ORF type:complete len:141 (-),score=20.39 TRINITY_DN58603_c0_g1_i1:610-1032(-)
MVPQPRVQQHELKRRVPLASSAPRRAIWSGAHACVRWNQIGVALYARWDSPGLLQRVCVRFCSANLSRKHRSRSTRCVSSCCCASGWVRAFGLLFPVHIALFPSRRCNDAWVAAVPRSAEFRDSVSHHCLFAALDWTELL